MNARELGLVLTEERVVVSSLDVARNFEKEHYDVLKAIRALDCSEEFTQGNFSVSEYKDSTGRPLPQYLITRDGFAFLERAKSTTVADVEEIKERGFMPLFPLLNTHNNTQFKNSH